MGRNVRIRVRTAVDRSDRLAERDGPVSTDRVAVTGDGDGGGVRRAGRAEERKRGEHDETGETGDEDGQTAPSATLAQLDPRITHTVATPDDECSATVAAATSHDPPAPRLG